VYTAGNPEAGEWHHLVYTYDGQTTRVYCDGVEANFEYLGPGAINTHAGTPITLALQMTGATGSVDTGTTTVGSLAIAQVRVHDGTLTLPQIRNNYELERAKYGAPEIPPEAPQFIDPPAEDAVTEIAAFYTKTLNVTGSPTPVIDVQEPAGGTVSESNVFSYPMPDPAPASFTVSLKATNGGGEATATWEVTVIRGAPLEVEPVHRYRFEGNVDDSIGSAHGVVYGDVIFEEGQAVLNNDPVTQFSGDMGLSPPADPPGAYIDLPNGIISELGQDDVGTVIPAAATFEVWMTWAGPIEGDDWSSSWQRIFDFGTSTSGEDWSDGGAETTNLILTPRSGVNTLRFGYRGPVPPDLTYVENVVDGLPMPGDVEYHVAVVWDELAEGGPTVTLYINGEKADENEVLFSLGEVVDVNNWLGRSQYAADAMMDGKYNELRIYDYALTHNQILGNYQEGADCLQGIEACGGPVGTTFVRGDANSDGSINLTDGINILGHLFLGDPEPNCLDGADADNSGGLVLTDAVVIFNWLFTGGAEPPAPSPSAPGYEVGDCGLDPTSGVEPPQTTDSLGCAKPSCRCEPGDPNCVE
jgi:hypothetical protein